LRATNNHQPPPSPKPRCRNCGTIIVGTYCTNCGCPVDQAPDRSFQDHHPRSEHKAIKPTGFGIASLVIAICGFASGSTLIVKIFGIIGFILGFIGLLAKNKKRGFAVAGTIISLLNLLMGFYLLKFVI
jgi:hypothetical protein